MRRSWVRLGWTTAAACAVLAFDEVTPLGLAVWLLHLSLIWSATFWAGSRQLVFVTVLCSVFIALGCWLSPDSGLPVWIEVVNRVGGVGAAWAIAHLSLRRSASERALALSEEREKILRGLLPLCAWCKKIRNEGGGWEQMEVYIRNHSQADFSHGICDECAKRQYAELDSLL